MSDIEKIYHNLTGVDIQVQQALWDERGKGYYGEYLVFKKLYPKLSGNCKILMNLQVPTDDGRTTEIDLLLIHETGLYVFEVKHYKGTIYGKSTEQKWTQYFRTEPNNSFYNPILQNQYHIKALQKRFPDTPIHSFIVFTSCECELRVECKELDITVCQLQNLYLPLHLLEVRNKIFDMSQIDSIFIELSAFSPMTAKSVNINGEIIPFHQYINNLAYDIEQEKNNLRDSFLSMQAKEKAKTRKTIIASIAACIIALSVSIASCVLYRTFADIQISSAQQELSEFAQKFEHVGEYNNGEIIISSSLITVSDVTIENATDILDTVNFSCKLNWNGTDYGVKLAKDTKYIVILKDGSVKEYDLFNSTFKFSSLYKIGQGGFKTYSLPVCEFYGIHVSDISYIKLTNTQIWKYLINNGNPLFDGYEIELYKAN